MRRTVVAFVVLFAIMLGAGAAGTPVNGDGSVAATTAGINMSTALHQPARPVSTPTETPRALVEVIRLIALLLTSLVVVAFTLRPEGDRSVLRWERRVTRGPPAPVVA